MARLVLIAPLVDYAEGKTLPSLAKVPMLSDWFARVFLIRAAVVRANGFFEESGVDPTYAARFEEQTRFEGFEQALLSMFRTDALTSYRDTYSALGDQPKLLIWGADDTDIALEHVEFIRSNAANVLFEQIANAGHGVNVQRKEEVNRSIIEFLHDSVPPNVRSGSAQETPGND